MNALSVDGLSKHFGGLKVLEGLSFCVEQGERLCILGPNGAGKSTLFNLLDGHLHPSAGSIKIFGRTVTHLSRDRRVALGMSRSYQLNTLFSSLTVLEHLRLALASRHERLLWRFWNSDKLPDLQRDAEALMVRTDLAQLAYVVAEQLSYGEQRRLEFALALASGPKVLLLDEPTSGLSRQETDNIKKIVNELPLDVTVLLVTHDVELAFEASRRILVLHHGAMIADGEPQEIAENDTVRQVYLGMGADRRLTPN